VYSDSRLDENMSRKLRAVKDRYNPSTTSTAGTKRDNSNMLHELVGNLQELVETYLPSEDSDDSTSDSSITGSENSSVDGVMLN
jgi:hypothetical protein